MTRFKDYIKNITIGAFPFKQNEHFKVNDYDVVINVSDEYYLDVDRKLRGYGLDTYWFPMNECKRDIGLNSIYGAMVILRECERTNKRVYLHCHAGINRSVSVFCAYYFMRTSSHIELIRSGFTNILMANCGRGYLPPKKELEGFLNNINENLNNEMQSGILDLCKIGVINNF